MTAPNGATTVRPSSGAEPIGPLLVRPRRRSIGTVLLFLLVGAVLVIGGLTLRSGLGAPTPVLPPPVAALKLTARGQVEPVSHAKVGTLSGGVVASLAVQTGAQVDEQQEIARIRGPNGTEVLTAPWRGTITSVPVHLGDTVLAGTVVVTVGDLTRLRIETTDVDEFLIAHVRRGQLVRATVDALDQVEIVGRVSSAALRLQTSSGGDEHYPVVIDIVGTPMNLVPGMTVRLDFGPE
ncbi:MAG: HlyD family efflux transporter periplasmic adaptor subunit [Chloroflexi bacterium]|nr:HlyD family efflux transporter periplasmic adaptor subunit [Chloroflexota bacterium]